MYSIIITIIIIVCVALTLIVLIQKPKGGGIASNFSAGNQIMGVKRTNELVEKLTWGLAVALLVLSLASNLFVSSTNATERSVIQDKIEAGDLPSTPATAPATPNMNPAPNPSEPAGDQPTE